jgi:hypothetical protein
VVIDDLDIFRVSANPAKADTELIVDADAVLPGGTRKNSSDPAACTRLSLRRATDSIFTKRFNGSFAKASKPKRA